MKSNSNGHDGHHAQCNALLVQSFSIKPNLNFHKGRDRGSERLVNC